MTESAGQIPEDLARQVTVRIIESAVRAGAIDLAGLSDEEALETINAFIREAIDAQDEIAIQITHQERILSEAKRYQAMGDHDLAVLMYATWAEHWLNGVLIAALDRQEVDPSEATQILKSTLHAKTGWIWTILYGSSMPTDVRASILRVADARNTFVHYKWTSMPDDPRENPLPRYDEVGEAASALMTRLELLEEELLFDGDAARVARLLG